jgi:hypothetical protein
LRRTLRNNSNANGAAGRAITRLRLLVTRITSQGSAPGQVAGQQADVRLISSTTQDVTTSTGTVKVYGTLLESPSNGVTTSGTTPNVATSGGGGLGSSLAFDVALPTPLQPGAEANYAFNLQIATSGNYLVAFSILALTEAPTPPPVP